VRAVLIPVADEWRALPVEVVREVVATPKPTRLPASPELLAGVFNLRGEIVPLFETAGLLGLGARPLGEFAVVVVTSAGPAGLAIPSLPQTAVLHEPVDHAGEDADDAPGWRVGDRLVRLLDLNAAFGLDHHPPELARTTELVNGR
jgi:purine-binding chemotaxis protein CheW